MIRLTRLNQQPIALNADLIKWIESSPDTVITLITGEKLVVAENCEEVIAAVNGYHRWLASSSCANRLIEISRSHACAE